MQDSDFSSIYLFLKTFVFCACMKKKGKNKMPAHLQKQLSWQMDFVLLLIYQCSALHKAEAGYDAMHLSASGIGLGNDAFKLKHWSHGRSILMLIPLSSLASKFCKFLFLFLFSINTGTRYICFSRAKKSNLSLPSHFHKSPKLFYF